MPRRPMGIRVMSEVQALSGSTSLLRPTWFEIDLDAISHNLRQLRRMVGSGVAIYACLKRNAYGCGAVPVAQVDAARGRERDRRRQHQRCAGDSRGAGEPADSALSELSGFGSGSGGHAVSIDADGLQRRRRCGLGAGGGRRQARRIRQDRRRTVPGRRDAARGARASSPHRRLERARAGRRLRASARLRSEHRRRLRGLAIPELPDGHASRLRHTTSTCRFAWWRARPSSCSIRRWT